jgi:hypothetical protein
VGIRGETIGAAYVRILADGAGFSKDVEREMRKNEPGFRAAGERSSKAYREGFRKEAEKQGKDPVRSLEQSLKKGAGRFDAVGSPRHPDVPQHQGRS